MTIAQYLPQWLRSKWQKPASQNVKILSKKDRQTLPTMPKTARSPDQLQDEDAALKFRVYWRM